MTTATTSPGVGGLLRDWRERRRLSQLDLATMADVSTRHLSYVENGRSQPSRELVLHLARHLDVPRREQNQFLLAAGYAPAFRELQLDDPDMKPVADALGIMMAAAEPNPALVFDRRWNLVLANESALAWTALVSPSLMEGVPNIARLTLHPAGLAGHIANFDEVAEHLLTRLRRQHALTGDRELRELLDEVAEYVPAPALEKGSAAGDVPVVIPMRLRVDGDEHAYASVVSTFGTAMDVTASELTIETFYPVR